MTNDKVVKETDTLRKACIMEAYMTDYKVVKEIETFRRTRLMAANMYFTGTITWDEYIKWILGYEASLKDMGISL